MKAISGGIQPSKHKLSLKISTKGSKLLLRKLRAESNIHVITLCFCYSIFTVSTQEDGKLCRKCKEFKSWDSFHKDRTQKDGFKKICKPCRSEVQKEYRTVKVLEPNEEDKLLQEARQLALRRLVQLHYPEFVQLLSRYKRQVGIRPKWINVK